MILRLALWAALLVGTAVSAGAAELRDYCPDRPGIGTPACIIDAGHASVELGVMQWSALRPGSGAAENRADLLSAGDLLLRLGLSSFSELQVGWSGYGWLSVPDVDGLPMPRLSGGGDVMLALRHSLQNPDGQGTAVAVMPWVTLPVGRQPMGAGDWAAGIIVPVSFELSPVLGLEFTPQVSAQVNENGRGRTLDYGVVVGLTAELAPQLSASFEYQVDRAETGADDATLHVLGLSMGWLAHRNLQVDFGGSLTPGGNSREFTLYGGIARRF